MNNPTIYRGYRITPFRYFKEQDKYDYRFERISDPEDNGIVFCCELSGVKDVIDERLEERPEPAHRVVTRVTLGGFTLMNITKFEWLEDAVKFAVQHNGFMRDQFLNP